MALPPPDPALADRFKRDWKAATGSAVADKALIAVSGGPDSSALLLLMATLQGAIAPSVAATVDHKLRAASSAEAGRAADLARACGIEHRILEGTLPERAGRTANVSARARALRYDLLETLAQEVGARWIVTAHHADDQLETMVMRLNRGSGVRGLGGIRTVTDRIVRPLLGWRGRELADLVVAAGVIAVNDPSNRDERFDRARLRKHLAGANWLDPAMASRSAAALAEADEAIEWAADLAEARHCQFGDRQADLKPYFLPQEIRRRLVERCLRHVDPQSEFRGRDVTRLMERLDAASAASLGNVACHVALTKDDCLPQEVWVFRPAPQRQDSASAR